MSETQWTHDGKDGSGDLILNRSDDPEDLLSTTILVRGRRSEEVAKRLAELLQSAEFVGA